MENTMTRNEEIHSKGFDLNGVREYRTIDNEFKQLKVGVRMLDDAVLNLGAMQKACPGHGYLNKSYVMDAIMHKNLPELRAISRFYYHLNGIYERACEYFAQLYRYDWYCVPEIYTDNPKEEVILKDFNKTLNFLDNSYIKKICGNIASAVVVDGSYYGYVMAEGDRIILQQLPVEYCRSRFNCGNKPAIEFNMKFFDTFGDPGYRMKVLNMFPDEFKKGYVLYKQGKLTPEFTGLRAPGMRLDDSHGWYLLDTKYAVKFNLNGSDVPFLVNSVPALLDLDAAQDLDRRKQMQKLLKIIVQKLPMDKNGDLIFDIDEARDIHNNAVEMLRRAVGVDVLTTFTDVESIDLSDKNTSTSTDDIERVERALFNALGISKNLFNTDGNLSLEKSALNDESVMRDLITQFNMFFNEIVHDKYCSNKKYCFKFYMLETTQYNYKDLSKLYKEQVTIGYSKMLPQIALGHSQSFILNSAHFENEVLHLSEIMIPPLQSSTMNADSLSTIKSGGNKAATNETKQTGRPEKPDEQKSAKTIANNESRKD